MFENEFLEGGLLLGLLAYVGALLRNVPKIIWHWVERNYTTLIIFDNHDPVYSWAEAWLHEHLSKMSTGHRRITRNNLNDSGVDSYRILPRPGYYTMHHYGRRLMIYYWRRRLESVFSGEAYSESIFIWYWGKNETVFKKIIEEGRNLASIQHPGKVVVYVDRYDHWDIHSVRNKRPWETISFAGDTGKDLLNDLKIYLNSKEEYERLGIQWKRGYLLHDAPGNGKSSTIFALASYLELPLYVLHLSSMSGDQQMMGLISNVPGNSILAIEDIDSAFDGRESSNDKISFSTFLNLFDGVISKDGQIVFITTNKYESLDKALIRPGRIDKIVEFGPADSDQIAHMAERFSNGSVVQAETSLEGESMAKVQEHYLRKATGTSRKASL